MNNQTTTPKPTLLFLRAAPAAAEKDLGIYNALQTFESSLLLLAFGRYPPALAQSVSAIESLLRNCFKCSDDESISLAGNLLDRACRKSQTLKDVSEKTSMQWAVQLRNDIIHRGSSPKDDAVSLEAFMGSTLPFFRSCLKELYGFELFDALLEDYRRHIDWARKAFHEAGRLGIANRTPSASALTAFMRWQEMEATAPEGSYASLQGCTDEGYRRLADIKDALEGTADNPWAADCPVCGSPAGMVVDLDGVALDEGQVTARRTACANCGYAVKGEWGFMVDILVGEQLERDRDEIIKTIVG